MTNLRPGLGSCTPNWGINDDRHLRDCLLRLDLAVSLRHTSDPTHGWIGPQAGDRRTEHRIRRSPSSMATTSLGTNEAKTVAARRPSED